MLDPVLLDDLTTFARAEAETRDVEPWADLLRVILDRDLLTLEEVTWLTVLYNTYDSFSSAYNVAARWPTPDAWLAADDRNDAKNYPIMQERRNLHGGRVNQRHYSYAKHVQIEADGNQALWFAQPLELDDPGSDFERLNKWVRRLVQVGRQAAYELCEFAAKVLDLPVDSTDGHLWESSGPRQSIEALYIGEIRDVDHLNKVALQVKDHLEDQGVPLSWWDYETIICDHHVGTKGRYYVGQHLQALKAEILEIDEVFAQTTILDCFESILPPDWRDIPPGIDKSRRGLYVATGEWATKPWW